MKAPAAPSPSPPGPVTWVIGAVLALFFVSGACGLVYEIIWTRLLRLVMGNTLFSITTVLCAFMGGLAAGSYLGGRFIDRRRDPLRVYAVLEAAVGVYCLLLPGTIHLAEPLYRVIYRNTHNAYVLFGLVRFLFCGAILLIPATFMGATLPVLSRFVARSTDRIGREIGRLYALNTFGAVLGAAGAGFVLVPAWGVTGTIRLACAANLLVAAAAYALHRRSSALPPPAPAAPAPPRPGPSDTVSAPPARGGAAAWVLLVAYGLSGLAALTYEVAWTRALSLAISSSVYAFSLMLTAFILGLAIGSMVLSRLADRWPDVRASLGVVELAIAVSALAASPVFAWLPLHLGGVVVEMSGAFWKLQLLEFGILVAVMLVPTTLMGVAFPLAARAYAAIRGGISRPVGNIYAANTLGSILGSFLAGFVLIPVMGMRGTILAAVGINTAVGLALLVASPSRRKLWLQLAAVGTVVAVGVGSQVLAGWDTTTLTFGPYWHARRGSLGGAKGLTDRQAEQAARSMPVVYHKEGAFDTVTVRQLGPYRVLCINGKPDASSGPDMQTQLLLGHLPMLLHGRAQSVLVIGLASGVTLGATSLYPARALDCAEISPDMPQATHLFDDVNHHILSDPRVKLFIADGRNHLALTDRTYDVIISEPSNPWIAGIADLFTREFFQLARRRLNEGGMVGIWVQGYSMQTRAFWSIAKAFAEVFPHVTIWELGRADTMLIGSPSPIRADLGRLEAEFAREPLHSDLAAVQLMSPQELLAQFLMDTPAVAAVAADAPVHTDDNALVEFSTPRTMFDKQVGIDLMEALNRHRGEGLDRLLQGEGGAAPAPALQDIARRVEARKHFTNGMVQAFYKQEDAAYAEYRRARQLDPNHPLLPDLLAEIRRDISVLASAKKLTAAAKVVEQGLSVFPEDPDLNFLRARLLYAEGKVAEAIEHYHLALEGNPDWVDAKNDLAWVLATTGDPNLRDGAEALRLAEQASQARPVAETLDTLAAALAETGQFDRAVATARRAAELARTAGQADLERGIQTRLVFYQSRQPYRER